MHITIPILRPEAWRGKYRRKLLSDSSEVNSSSIPVSFQVYTLLLIKIYRIQAKFKPPSVYTGIIWTEKTTARKIA